MKRTLTASVALTALVVGMSGVYAQISQSPGVDKPAATSGSTSSSVKPDAPAGEKGASSAAPGQTKPEASTSTPGKPEAAPGQTRPNVSTSAPGKSETAPGQTKPDAASAPGKSEAAPGQTKTDPSTAKPAETKPADGKPSTGDTTAKPAETKTPDSKATDSKPASGAGTANTGTNTGNATSGSSSSSSSSASSSSASSASVNLNTEQQTKVSQAFSSVNVQPVTNVNFSVSVGTVINEQVTFHELPPAIVQIVPQFRGYRYIVVRDQIVIVEPKSKRIVYVMSRSGGSSKRSSLSISGDKRSMVKKSLASGPKVTKTIKVEQDMVVPQDIELSTVSETIVSDLPELRSYRYFVYEDQVVFVEPETRRVIEIIR